MKKHYVVNLFVGVLALILSACAAVKPASSLYEQLGGMPVLEEIVDNFVNEIGNDRVIVQYFANTNIDRFREKMIEQLCVESGGPCQYTGDTMLQVHAGMQVNERDFNQTVDLLINAMNEAGVAHPLQNKLLARLAPMRSDIIYH